MAEDTLEKIWTALETHRDDPYALVDYLDYLREFEENNNEMS